MKADQEGDKERQCHRKPGQASSTKGSKQGDKGEKETSSRQGDKRRPGDQAAKT